jgi:3-oxoadipate enol-lactonase
MTPTDADPELAADPAGGFTAEPVPALDADLDPTLDPEAVPHPWLPPAREVELPGRGTLRAREIEGPPGAPTLVLLHGWTATADLNWFTCYAPLGEHYRVVAFDHRGHGTGLRSKKAFRLEDCADDAVAVADALGIDRFVAVGYSMGGPVAQLVWKQARERLDGLVLCATAPYFADRREERWSFLGLTGLAALARVTPLQARDWLTSQFYLQRKSSQWEPWAVRQAASHDWRMVLEAGSAIGSFSATDWIDQVDVPTSVVVTMRDPVVPLHRQVKLFEWIPGAEAFRVDGAHDAVVANADRFVPTLLRAVASVVGRRPLEHAAVEQAAHEHANDEQVRP